MWLRELRIQQSLYEDVGLITGLTQWVKDPSIARDRWQMWLRTGVAMAVAQARSCSSNATPSLGTSICHRCSPKKQNKNKQKKTKNKTKNKQKTKIRSYMKSPQLTQLILYSTEGN